MSADAVPATEPAPAPGAGSKGFRPGIADVLCIGPILLHLVYFYATIGVGPSLIGTRPLLLAGLRGSIPALLTVGAFASVGRVPLWAALLVPVPNLIFADPFFYWAGRRYGRRLVGYLGRNDARMRRKIERGERQFARFGVWAVLLAMILPAPSPLFYMAAGETGMPFAVFLAADVAGTLLYIAGNLAIGWVAGQHAVDLAAKISQYGLVSTIALVAAVVAWSMWSAWRGARDDQAERG